MGTKERDYAGEMSLTLEELKLRLRTEFDEVTLLELLDISAEDIVEVFQEKIEARFTKLVTELGEEEWSEDNN